MQFEATPWKSRYTPLEEPYKMVAGGAENTILYAILYDFSTSHFDRFHALYKIILPAIQDGRMEISEI